MNEQNQIATYDPNFLPDYLRDQTFVSSMAGELVDKTPRISTRGGKFRFVKGDVVSEPMSSIEVIPVRIGPTGAQATYRVLYLNDFDPNKPAAPDCWSPDGIAPSDKSRAKQSASCATCAKNVAGSGKNNSRACRFSKTLAVVSPSDWNTVYRLNLPASTLFDKELDAAGYFGWRGFIDRCALSKAPPESFLLKLDFPRESTEGFRFNPVRYLQKDEFEYVVNLSKDQKVIDLVTLDIHVSEAEEEVAQQTTQQPPQAPPPQAVPQAPPPVQQTTYAPPPQAVPQAPPPQAVPQAPPPQAVPQAPPPVQQAQPVFEQSHLTPPPKTELTDERRARIDALIADV